MTHYQILPLDKWLKLSKGPLTYVVVSISVLDSLAILPFIQSILEVIMIIILYWNERREFAVVDPTVKSNTRHLF